MEQARRVLIVAASLLVLAVLAGPDLRRVFGHPLGVAPVSIDFRGVVRAVDNADVTPAVHVLDRLDFARAGPDERFGYAPGNTADAGEQGVTKLLRGHASFTATGNTHAEASRAAMVWLRAIIQLLVATLGAVVVLRRPSVATWGFFICMALGLAPMNDVYLLGPLWWRRAAWFLYWQADVLPQYGALYFALHLLHDGPLPRWRTVAQNVAVAVTGIACIAMLWHAWALLYWNQVDIWGSYAFVALSTLPLLVAPVILIATFYESTPNVRERLRWIIGGFAIGTACNVFDLLGSQGNLGVIQMSYVTHSLLVCGVYVPIALPVAYAILKHHIIDVNVAISRATAYTALSVTIVGAFALVDFFFTSVLAEKNAGIIAEIAVALVLGFSINTMHARIDSFVDSILFRARHVALGYVEKLAHAMSYAHSRENASSMLVDEPVRAFQLTGAKLYSVGDAPANGMATLAASLEAQRECVRLSDGQWDLHAFFHEAWLPAAVIPIFSHSTLDAAVFYGFHRNGTTLDREEIERLQELASAAGAAFDRLEADELRRENATLRMQLSRGSLI